MLAQSQPIDIALAPSIPGLTFRPFRGEVDFEPMVEIGRRSNRTDGVDDPITLQELAKMFAHPINWDPARDVLLADVGEQTVGYIRVQWRVNAQNLALYAHFGFVHPDWRRRGIGTALLQWGETRLREINSGHSFAPDISAVFASYTPETRVGKVILLEKAGYTPVRHFFQMIRPNLDDLPAGPLPPGIELRPVSPAQYRQLWDANEEAFRDHWGYILQGEQEFQRWLAHPLFDPTLWQVAWDGDQIAGMALNTLDIDPAVGLKRGWVEDLSVRRPWRKRGLGRALLVNSFQEFKRRGMTQAGLGVDAENWTGALRLYESVGFRVARRDTAYHKPVA